MPHNANTITAVARARCITIEESGLEFIESLRAGHMQARSHPAHVRWHCRPYNHSNAALMVIVLTEETYRKDNQGVRATHATAS
jgi:hypothetical protein